MNAAAEILSAVRQAGAALRVEGVSLVASNASRIAPAIKAAIRENKPQIISALLADGTACKVTIIELPQAQRYRKVFGVLQLKPPALVPVERWRQCVEDGKRFLAAWGSQAEALGWTTADLFGLHTPPERPHPSYRRLSRYDCTGLIWLLEGRPVVALTEATASIKGTTVNITVYRKHNKPALGRNGASKPVPQPEKKKTQRGFEPPALRDS
jgi:hypothetical protein